MNIRNTRELKSFAAQRLSHASNTRQILLLYAAVTLGLSALVTVISYVLGLQIDQMSGLSNFSNRTILSTLQTMLPTAASLITICIDLGLIAAMLRTARGQYTSAQTLRLGFDRFWLLMRCTIFKNLIYFAMITGCVYLGIMIYLVTPLSGAATEMLMPVLSETSILNPSYVLDDATYAQLLAAMWPAFLICGILLCVVLVPLMYSYRMVNYVVIDKPAIGALAALRESKMMMRGNRLSLLKMDLGLWWYHLAVIISTYVICYGDILLPMVGVELPWHEDVSYFLFFALYLAAMFAIYYFLRARAEVTYALAYDAVKPEEKQDNGVVLGNIFQM